MKVTITSDHIREEFLSFFESKGHLRVKSASLIPVGDPTLLLTIAGMNQFKPYFSGQQTPPNRRLTSSQKCFRTPDIDVVGDATHNTMFEMLGNFSIGDYFKKEAISYALEFLTQNLKLPIERFGITIHETDDESQILWEDVGIASSNIYKFGDSDNWWGPPIHGEEGPCGPCSELHYDFGAQYGCGDTDCKPNCENLTSTNEVCNRYVELWNLVFMQYYHHPDGSRDSLPAPSIDTGMGLERATIIMQEVQTMYETDIFSSLVDQVSSLTSVPYGASLDSDYAIRAIAEHSRSSTFLTADGVVPGNEGRGYVLRRVIRRAIRLGKKLGIEGAFLGSLSESVIKRMGDVYPELVTHKDFILTVLALEEERFQQAFENGYLMLEEAMVRDNDRINGRTVFQLWDTYGFPVEMTQEIAEENNISVDMEGFNTEMESQRKRARAGSQFDGDHARIRVYEELGVGSTNFTGYETLNGNSVIVGIVNESSSSLEARKGEKIEIILQETPFYSEGGGQVGDCGKIIGPNGEIKITDTREMIPGMIVHFGQVSEGIIGVGDMVETVVDKIRREDTARNHTATHMLHAALREILGPHVRQAGSLVTPERLRFDFSHVKAVTKDEMWRIQSLVNEKIRHNANIIRTENTYTGALENGALAFFGDKYGETVRLVEIANGGRFSFEVCGGTHVDKTGEVGSVYVIGESSIGAGMRRIEAISGREAEKVVWEKFSLEQRLVQSLQTTSPELETRVSGLLEQLEEKTQQLSVLERKLAIEDAKSLLSEVQIVDGISLISAETSISSSELLRASGDYLKDKIGSGVVALGSVIESKPVIIVMITPDLITRGLHAGNFAKEAAKIIGGGGGGRPESSQAGGKEASKLNEALASIPNLLSKSLDK